MSARRACCAVLSFAVGVASVTASEPLSVLYAQHRWPELRASPALERAPSLYRGAVAAAFNDRTGAEAHLRAAIRRAPRSEEAREAYSILAHLDLDLGLYR